MSRRFTAFLLTFLLALGCAQGALALRVTSEDIAYPIFPWGAYTLQMSLYTDDTQQINYAAEDGTMVLLRLKSVSGQIALKDIKADVSLFALRDANGDTYTPAAWRTKGAQSEDGKFTAYEMQDGFELLYRLPRGVDPAGATLVVDPSAKERVIVRLGKENEADEPAPEATPTPTPTATPSPTPSPTPAQAASGALVTDPRSVTITCDGKDYLIHPRSIGRNDEGKTTLEVDGFGLTLRIRNNEMVIHVQATILAQGKEYKWKGLALNDGRATFNFDTDLTPEVIYLYANGGEANRVALTVESVAAIQTPAKAEPAATGTPEPEPEPDPEPEPEPAADVFTFIEDLLAEQAGLTNDPWVRAILSGGFGDAEYEGGGVSFSLRSYNPGLESLGKYEDGREDYLARLYENASAPDLMCMLPAANVQGVLTASDTDVKAFLKTVSAAAAKAKTAFDDKRVRIALSDYLLNGETASNDLDWNLSPECFAPLFLAQTKQTLSVTDGPAALKLKCTGADGAALAEKGYNAAYLRLSKQAYSNALSRGEIEEVFLEELNAQAAAIKKSGAKAYDFAFNIDALLGGGYPADAGEDFGQYLTAYADAYERYLDQLEEKVADLPDIPALDYPKSGRMSGSSGGTKVIFKTPSDGEARYLQMRKCDTDEVAVSAFIRPGGSATVYVPKGDYYIMVASGITWYGTEYLFGDDGTYSRTQDTQIKSSSYYHTITLGGVVDGNMSSYGADASDFM